MNERILRAQARFQKDPHLHLRSVLEHSKKPITQNQTGIKIYLHPAITALLVIVLLTFAYLAGGTA